MKNHLLSAAIGDIAGRPYEGRRSSTKDYNAVRLTGFRHTYTDDTVCTFACAEALAFNLDMAENLWKRCRQHSGRGFGGSFKRWLMAPTLPKAYNSFGNGSAMRASAAGFLARTEEECFDLAAKIAMPTHNHTEGIKGAVATALTIFYATQGRDKEFIRQNVLDKFYHAWSSWTYADIHNNYTFDSSCQLTVPAAIICFLDSNDYADCITKAIALGGDADTLAAIAGPMAYAFFGSMPEPLVHNALNELPGWMLAVNEAFDKCCSDKESRGPQHIDYSPDNLPLVAQSDGNLPDGITTVRDVIAYYKTLKASQRPRFTPDRICRLQPNEVFVFGSNLAGMHAGGAARTAVKLFGAKMGQGVGLQGQSYAIPTMQGGVDTIRPYVDDFTEFARQHTDLFFYVTRIGCGIAGFRDSQIAPLFAEAAELKNVCLPESFANIINSAKD